jgi:hypothetical protein
MVGPENYAIRGTEEPLALLVDPDVLHPPVIIDAVDLLNDALNVRLPAGGGAIMEDDRPPSVLLQLAVYFPYQL